MQTDPTPARAAAEPGAAPPAPTRVTARFMLSHPAHLVSLGFGSGLAPIMPGTFGSLFGWLTFVVLNRYLTVPEWWALIAVGFVAGAWVTGFTARKAGVADPGKLSGAIGEVLACTGGGLGVGIPAFTPYYVLPNLIAGSFKDLEKRALSLFRKMPYDQLAGTSLDESGFTPGAPALREG